MTQSSSRSKEQTKRQQQHPLFPQNLPRTSYHTYPSQRQYHLKSYSIIICKTGYQSSYQHQESTNQRTQSAESPWLHSFETGYTKRYVYPWETGKNSLENRPSTVFFLLVRFPRAIVINLNHQPREPTRTDSTTPSMLYKREEISENRDF